MRAYLDGRRQSETPCPDATCRYEGEEKLIWYRGRREAQKTRAALRQSVGTLRGQRSYGGRLLEDREKVLDALPGVEMPVRSVARK